MAVRLYENSHPFLGTLVTLMGIAFSLGATMDFLLLTKVKKKIQFNNIILINIALLSNFYIFNIFRSIEFIEALVPVLLKHKKNSALVSFLVVQSPMS